MSTTDQISDLAGSGHGPEPRIALDLSFREAEALRAWLLKATADGATSLDDQLVSETLSKLAHALDDIYTIINIRHELEQAGLDIAHLSDEQVRELGRRVSEAALPSVRG